MKLDKKGKSRKPQRTIKVSIENHKALNIFKIENDLKTMNKAIEKLLQLGNIKEISEIPAPEYDPGENLN